MTFTYADAMAFIHERSGYDRGFISNPFAGDEAARLGLVRTERLLEALGRPDRSYPILHVAGSKGKGSTSTILASILTASGLTTGRFLSPHLHRFNERFAIDGTNISDAEFASSVEQVRAATLAVEQHWPEIGQLTAWELSTCIALSWFQHHACQAVVLEVGMGGTLDATNVVEPAASLITRLDLEHTVVLGSTIGEIAANKAGIIKPHAPAFSVEQEPYAMRVIVQRAAEMDVQLSVAGLDWVATGTSDDFSYSGGEVAYEHLTVGLEGRHQVENAGLAIAALTSLAATDASTWPVTEESVRAGLANATIPGRFEVVAIDEHLTVVIDGAHTPASMAMLAETVAARFPDGETLVIAGMLSDKSPEDVLAPLIPLADIWVAAAPQTPRALPVSELVAALNGIGVTARPASSVAAALHESIAARKLTQSPSVIVVTGSLSTVAEARTALQLDRVR